MDVIRPKILLRKIKLSLVFFCLVLIWVGCRQEVGVRILDVNYENDRPISVTFASDINVDNLRVFVGEESNTSVIGVVVSLEDSHSFIPAIPFTPGQTYTIRKGDTEVVAKFTVKDGDGSEPPEILAIYPTNDTVPENLLKMYIQFSRPMQEVGRAMDFITVTDNTTGKEVQVFLELESELWNREHDRLTLWLDPGRIKTDLIPNRELGLPILNGHSYTLRINDAWKSARGQKLGQSYAKQWIVTKRDNKKPEIANWEIEAPRAKTWNPLQIHFGESMDAILAVETIAVLYGENEIVDGDFELMENETRIDFTPQEDWKKGNYRIEVKAILEDLAGNNLNRLFDEDITKTKGTRESKPSYHLNFSINR